MLASVGGFPLTYADGTADEATAKTYYNADGTIDYEEDELGRRTDYDYDLLGRMILAILPDPDAGGPLGRPEIEYEYDSLNRLENKGVRSIYQRHGAGWALSAS